MGHKNSLHLSTHSKYGENPGHSTTTMKKGMAVSFKTTLWHRNSNPRYSREMKDYVHVRLSLRIIIAASFIIANTGNCPSIYK